MIRSAVLLVDSNVNWRRAYRERLEARGYEVEEAASVKEAVETLTTLPLDLVVVELRLADDNDDRDFSGLEVAKVIATHDLEMALELCERGIIMDDGRVIADGLTSDILRDANLLQSHGLEVPYSLR